MLFLRSLTLLACLMALAVAVAACGDEEPGVDEPAREGLALPLDGVEYNVFITRQLNPAIPADDAFFEGPEPGPDENLYGVFIQACNNTEDVHETVDEFLVKDNHGNEFEPERAPRGEPVRLHAAANSSRKSASPRRAAWLSRGRPAVRCCCSGCRSSSPRTARSSSRSRARATRSSPSSSISSAGLAQIPASRTTRAAGAAVAPPAPARTNITPTAIFGLAAGA